MDEVAIFIREALRKARNAFQLTIEERAVIRLELKLARVRDEREQAVEDVRIAKDDIQGHLDTICELKHYKTMSILKFIWLKLKKRAS